MNTNQTHTTKKKHNKHGANQWWLPLVLIGAIILLLFMFRNVTLSDRAIEIPHEYVLETVVGYAILITELAALLVVGISVLEVIFDFVRGLVDKNTVLKPFFRDAALAPGASPQFGFGICACFGHLARSIFAFLVRFDVLIRDYFAESFD